MTEILLDFNTLTERATITKFTYVAPSFPTERRLLP